MRHRLYCLAAAAGKCIFSKTTLFLLLWGLPVSILVAVLLQSFLGEAPARSRTGPYLVVTRSDTAWTLIVQNYMNDDDLAGAVEIVARIDDPSEQEDALRSLIDGLLVRTARPPSFSPGGPAITLDDDESIPRPYEYRLDSPLPKADEPQPQPDGEPAQRDDDSPFPKDDDFPKVDDSPLQSDDKPTSQMDDEPQEETGDESTDEPLFDPMTKEETMVDEFRKAVLVASAQLVMSRADVHPASGDQKEKDANQNADGQQEWRRSLNAFDDFLIRMRPSRMKAPGFGALAFQYRKVGDKERESQAYDQMQAAQQEMNGLWKRVLDYFRPIFFERLSLFLCGVMVVLVFVFKPTVAKSAEALAIRIHHRNRTYWMQKALGNNPPEPPTIAGV